MNRAAVAWMAAADKKAKTLDARCRYCGTPGTTRHAWVWPDDPNLFDQPVQRSIFVCSDERCGTDDRWLYPKLQSHDLLFEKELRMIKNEYKQKNLMNGILSATVS